MKGYWIHYIADEVDKPLRFGIIEADESGRQRVISPSAGIESASEAVSLLIAKGIDANEAQDRVEAAMQYGVAHLLARDAEA